MINFYIDGIQRVCHGLRMKDKLRIKNKRRRYSIPIEMRHAFYFCRMLRSRSECKYCLYNDLRWPGDEQVRVFLKQVRYQFTDPGRMEGPSRKCEPRTCYRMHIAAGTSRLCAPTPALYRVRQMFLDTYNYPPKRPF